MLLPHRSSPPFLLGAVVMMIACEATPVAPPRTNAPPPPVPGEFLDRAPHLRSVSDPRLDSDPISKTGLIAEAMLEPMTGYPLTGERAHAAVLESEATYARLDVEGDYAPTTFEAWKERFGFPSRTSDESLESWRRRAGVYVYYNLNELGLGRELGCAEFADHDDEGAPATGTACFVTNYGATFDNLQESFADAVRGSPVRNTVCIAFIPSLPEGAEVQFFVYGTTGQRQTWAQLDHLGARPHPFVCTNCHGGAHDPDEHLTFGARFLPTQPYNLWFGPEAPYDRASQEEAIRRANALAFGAGPDGNADQKLTAAQREVLASLYAYDGGDIHAPGQVISPTWVPPEWSGSPLEADLYAKVIDPYCMTCHAALEGSAYDRLAAPEELLPWIGKSVCGDFSMPNAQQTSHRFWGAGGAVDIAGQDHASAADALLAWAGLERDTCPELVDVVSCARDGRPEHDLCGNDHSGRVCLTSGHCGPDLGGVTSLDYEAPLGYCEIAGPRGCPSGTTCLPLAATTPDGWGDGACYGCGRPGMPACP